MSRIGRGRAASPDDAARRSLDRAVAMLLGYQRQGLTVVSIEDVLTLLGAGSAAVPAASLPGPVRDPRADPMTGALWAGAPGTSPPAA